MANNAVTITVPEAAIASYELTVKNGIVQGCNREDLICDAGTRTCGPATSPVNGFYSLTCSNNALQAFGGSFGFSQTFVIDRNSERIHMPIPLVTVRCSMRTMPTSAIIDPAMRDPKLKVISQIWKPTIKFFKTEFSVVPGVPANNGQAININGNAEVGYIIGEKLHVRIEGVLDNQLPTGAYNVNIRDCSLSELTASNQVAKDSQIQLITNGVANPNSDTPVGIEKNPGMLNSGMPGNSGAGFWFQVFTYRTGSKLQLYCSARFTPFNNGLGRKRRSTEEEEEDHEIAINLRVFEEVPESINAMEIPTILESQEERIIDWEPTEKLFDDDFEDEYFEEMIEEEEMIEDEIAASFWLKLLVISSATFLLLSILYQFFCRPTNNNATVYIKEDKLLLQ